MSYDKVRGISKRGENEGGLGESVGGGYVRTVTRDGRGVLEGASEKRTTSSPKALIQ